MSSACCWRLRTSLRSIDLDEVFSYQTSKIVVVKDRWLGLLRLLMVVLIFLYVIVYVIWFQQKYLEIEVPVGVAYTSLLKPNTTTYPQNYKYCQEYVAQTGKIETIDPRPCLVWDANEALFPVDQHESIFITTRTSITDEIRVCGGEGQNVTNGCQQPWNTPAPPREYYIADIDSFTIRVQHSFQARVFWSQTKDKRFSRVSTEMQGSIRDSNDNPIYTFPFGKPDVLPIKLLLSSAGVALENPADTPDALVKAESMRHSGIILLVFLSYDNLKTAEPAYTYYVSRVANSEYKVLQTNQGHDANSRTVYNRHGIKMIFIQSGQIGRFSFQATLLQLVTSLGLLSVSTLIVDQIMLLLMPHRKWYTKYKFLETIDFSQVTDEDDAKFEKDPADTLEHIIANEHGHSHEHGPASGPAPAPQPHPHPHPAHVPPPPVASVAPHMPFNQNSMNITSGDFGHIDGI
eukprot:TRINITY_DN3370_c0_g1_i3.p1 TRINITY_DN3370_c0_g1~~TRINITY_DN3370_c0_g1_i3.p1  ORF type:complete len:461 (-),score=130.75 TRINITY_DN3370_c0_g1_i3:262-1644(-)